MWLRLSILLPLLPIVFTDKEADGRRNLRSQLVPALTQLVASPIMHHSSALAFTPRGSPAGGGGGGGGGSDAEAAHAEAPPQPGAAIERQGSVGADAAGDAAAHGGEGLGLALGLRGAATAAGLHPLVWLLRLQHRPGLLAGPGGAAAGMAAGAAGYDGLAEEMAGAVVEAAAVAHEPLGGQLLSVLAAMLAGEGLGF